MNLERKTITMQLKDGEKGELVAQFSTFDVVDKDGDVVLASAFTPGQEVPLTWSHDWSAPVGKGTIVVEPTRALFAGRFFTETEAGKEAYKTVKAMGPLQQYSWGFQVTDSAYETRNGEPVRVIRGAKVFEVSPVLVGAGENTATLAIKAGQPYVEQAEAALAAAKALVGRTEVLAALRAKEGRVLSTANREKLGALLDALSTVSQEIGSLLEATARPEPEKGLSLDYLERRLRASGVALAIHSN